MVSACDFILDLLVLCVCLYASEKDKRVCDY